MNGFKKYSLLLIFAIIYEGGTRTVQNLHHLQKLSCFMFAFECREHLGRPAPVAGEERDFEEEFYYTEVEPEADSYHEVTMTYFGVVVLIQMTKFNNSISSSLLF